MSSIENDQFRAGIAGYAPRGVRTEYRTGRVALPVDERNILQAEKSFRPTPILPVSLHVPRKAVPAQEPTRSTQPPRAPRKPVERWTAEKRAEHARRVRESWASRSPEKRAERTAAARAVAEIRRARVAGQKATTGQDVAPK